MEKGDKSGKKGNPVQPGARLWRAEEPVKVKEKGAVIGGKGVRINIKGREIKGAVEKGKGWPRGLPNGAAESKRKTGVV